MKIDKIDIANLPTDVPVLHQIIIDLFAELKELKTSNLSLQKQVTELQSQVTRLQDRLRGLQAKNTTLKEQNIRLIEQNRMLRHKVFGHSSEKLIQNFEQETEDEYDEADQINNTGESDGNGNGNGNNGDCNKNKTQPKRQKLPTHLPRTKVVLEPPAICPQCGGDQFRQIGQDTSEVLEHVPESFRVIEYIRPVCACIACDKILQAYQPSNPIAKGKAGPGLLAYIITQKYCNHLPMYRQSQIYQREGIELSRSTMISWAAGCASLLEPLVIELRKSIFASSHIHGDDTIVKVLEPGLGRTKTGRIWIYVRDGRPYGDKTTPPAICYFYSPDRKGERPESHLKDFRGTFHADAYGGYDRLYQSNDITEAACWGHTRRKFYEITIMSDNAKTAYAVLEQMKKIYEIEEEIKGLAPEKRLKIRQEKSRQLVDDLFANLKSALTKLPKQSATTKAINYAMNNKQALMRFLEDGKVQIDNNIVERAARGVALGRKNWLFAGSDNGGKTAAIIYSLIETAKLNNINPLAYLTKVLATIADHNSQKLAELLPWNLMIKEKSPSG